MAIAFSLRRGQWQKVTTWQKGEQKLFVGVMSHQGRVHCPEAFQKIASFFWTLSKISLMEPELYYYADKSIQVSLKATAENPRGRVEKLSPEDSLDRG